MLFCSSVLAHFVFLCFATRSLLELPSLTDPLFLIIFILLAVVAACHSFAYSLPFKMVVVDQHEYLTQEEKRLRDDTARTRYWKKWGPYVAERQWATGKSITAKLVWSTH